VIIGRGRGEQRESRDDTVAFSVANRTDDARGELIGRSSIAERGILVVGRGEDRRVRDGACEWAGE
jgi:hypothetical protein